MVDFPASHVSLPECILEAGLISGNSTANMCVFVYHSSKCVFGKVPETIWNHMLYQQPIFEYVW